MVREWFLIRLLYLFYVLYLFYYLLIEPKSIKLDCLTAGYMHMGYTFHSF